MLLVDLTDPAAFTDQELCARCGLPGSDHRPPASYTDSKSGASSGKAHKIQIHARTCCWAHPLTTCIAFAREDDF
jgi:hypothetical protein